MRLYFGDFCFDTDRRDLSEKGSIIHLTPKAVDLLRFLIDARPKIIPKEEIYQRLWPDTYVEEANLSVHISELRAALHDDSKKPRFVKTAHRVGYGFIGDVRPETPHANSGLRLSSGRREFDLVDGENIIGRDGEAAIRLNGPGISRRHARIIVAADRVTIEDLGSKNGTYVQGERIAGVRELHDGDEIRVSRELLVISRPHPLGSTVTDIH
jgi:DNA-binding winged helix-turn-helix (wHTH) protein